MKSLNEMKRNYEKLINDSIYLGCLRLLCCTLKGGNSRGKTLNFDHDRTYCENTKCQNIIHSLILYFYKGSIFAVKCNICRDKLKIQNILCPFCALSVPFYLVSNKN